MKSRTVVKSLETELREAIIDVPDFPKKGIIFKDITPILRNGALFQKTIDFFAQRYAAFQPDVVVSVESRGFLLGGPLAARLGSGLVPVRKIGKLPRTTRTVNYELEYGKDGLQIHVDDLGRGDRVLVVDDVLATGGTTSAVIQLLDQAGVEILEVSFLIELVALKGREKLGNCSVFSLIKY